MQKHKHEKRLKIAGTTSMLWTLLLKITCAPVDIAPLDAKNQLSLGVNEGARLGAYP